MSQEKDQIWLWIPVLLAFGMVFALSFPAAENFQILFAFAIFFTAIALWYYNRFSYRCLLYIVCATFLFGFIWASFYQKIHITDQAITGKIYTDLEGKITKMKHFTSTRTGKKGAILTLEDLTFYKADFSKSKAKKARVKPKPPKMTKKFLKKHHKCGQNASCIARVKKAFEKHEAAKKKRRADKKNKPKTFTQKQITRDFLNLSGYQEIDRDFLSGQHHYQHVNWQKQGEKYVFPNPPRSISVSTYAKLDGFAIGDVIALRASLAPSRQKEFIGGFDYSLHAAFQKISGHGRAMGEVKILKKSEISSFHAWIGSVRTAISSTINRHLTGDQAAVAQALMVGKRGEIAQDTITAIRHAGLAHLLAISGIHMGIAAFIFFVCARFLLSRSQYVTLHFNIKKAAAIAAIVSAYMYLHLAGSPIPATRSFIMVALVLLAVFIDRKTDLKRSIALAAFILLLLNPYSVFSAGFQFSFSAILSLACFHDFFSKLKPESISHSWIKKSVWYFVEIALASIVVQIATAPFLIYHFNNFPTYGLLANMFAIPLTTIVTMPLGFLSLAFIPFGLEEFPLKAMGISISWIVQTAHFIASLDYAYFLTPQMPKTAFGFAVGSWLIMCLAKSKMKWLLGCVFLLSFASLCFVKQPDLLFDSQQKFFAFYSEKDGLVFSKKLRKSSKRNLWMKEMREDEFKYFDQYSKQWLAERGIVCDEKKCEIHHPNGSILIVKTRSKIAQICANHHFDLVVNLNSKYRLPACLKANKKVINSVDFNKKGAHFIYFKDKELAIKTVR